MWTILGIEKTTDEAAIKDAYREKLIYVNPEENPEGFKELRQAYEEACAWAHNAKKEKGPLEQWVYDMEQLYDNFYYRIDEDEWDEIFENDLCTDLDTEEDARNAMINFCMHHYLVPQFVWKRMWDLFEFEENREHITEQISADFMTYIEHRAHNEDYFDYQLFEGPVDADYDGYIKDVTMMKLDIDDKAFDKAEPIVHRVELSPITHPYVTLELARFYYYQGDEHYKGLMTELGSELYENPYYDDLVAEIYMDQGEYEKALPLLKKARQDNTSYVQITRHLVKTQYELGLYEEGKAVCLEVLEDKVPDDYVCNMLMDINEELIRMWKDIPEKKMDMGWCYYQNQDFEACRALLDTMKPEGEWEFDYYNLLARVLLETKEFERGYETTKIWIRNIEQLKGDEKDYIRKSRRYGYAHFIASMFCLELGMDDKCDEYLKRAIELDHQQMDLLMYRERRMDSFLNNKRYQDCIHEANLCLEISEFFYPAYLYRQEANYKLYRVQQVIDDFHRAVEIAPNQGKPYVTLIHMLIDIGVTNEIDQLLAQAKENGVDDPELDFYALDFERYHTTDQDEMKNIARKMEGLMKKLPEKKAEISYRLALIYDRLCQADPDQTLGIYMDKSIRYAKDAVKNDKTVPQHFWLLADIYHRAGKYEKAIHGYQRVLELDPTLLDAYVDMGNTYLAMDRKKEAIQIFEKALALKDDHEYLHNTVMNQYLALFSETRKKDYYDQAILHASRQLEIEANAYYYRERAYVYIENMEYEKAYDDMVKSYELAPEDLYALSSMGYICRLMGRYPEAIAYYKKAEPHAETEQQKYGMYHWWAPIYTRNGDYEEAIKCLQKCLKIDPKAADIHEEIAENYMRLRDFNKAIKHYEKAVAGDHHAKAFIMMDLARAYLYNKNPIKLRRILKQVELQYGDDPKILCKIGEFYLEEKDDPKKAYKYYYHACDQSTEEPYLRLVEIYAKMGKTKDAQKMARLSEKILKQLYGSVDGYFNQKENQKYVYYNVALMYYYSGEKEVFRQYIKRMKELPMCYFCTHGCCYEQLLLDAMEAYDEGRYEEGLALIDQVCKEDSTIGVAYCVKNMIEMSNNQ